MKIIFFAIIFVIATKAQQERKLKVPNKFNDQQIGQLITGSNKEKDMGKCLESNFLKCDSKTSDLSEKGYHIQPIRQNQIQ